MTTVDARTHGFGLLVALDDKVHAIVVPFQVRPLLTGRGGE